jgi:hypothetical protein
MLRPTPGELLAGVRRELREQVLPHVPAGEPARQLRAALHVLGRLERSWDLLPSYLTADNDDLRSAITQLAGHLDVDRTYPPTSIDATAPGVTDRELRALIAENMHLQSELDRLQQERRAGGDTTADTTLLAVHTRAIERALQASGVEDTG